MHRLSVVVATRNRCHELIRTLRHLQALPEAPPLVIVDNGSTDDTAALVETDFPAVRLLRCGRNLGAVARNLGAAATDTPYVAFADDDSWWAPHSLARAAEVFDAHPRLGLLAARTLVGPASWLDPVSVEMADSPLGVESDLPGPSVLGFLACSAVVRRAAFDTVGGFAELLFFGGEETLLSLDLAAAGWGLAYVADVIAHHHPSAQRPPAADREAQMLRNDLLVSWLRRPLNVAAGQTARLVQQARHDPLARAALLGLLPRLPRALRERRPLPQRVEDAVRRLEARPPWRGDRAAA